MRVSTTKTLLIMGEVVCLILIIFSIVDYKKEKKNELTKVDLYYNADDPSEIYSRDVNNPSDWRIVPNPEDIQRGSSPYYPLSKGDN